MIPGGAFEVIAWISSNLTRSARSRAEPPAHTDIQYLVMSKAVDDHQANLTALNNALAEMKADGIPESIMATHGFWPELPKVAQRKLKSPIALALSCGRLSLCYSQGATKLR